MAREPRRIVPGHDAEGKSVLVIDGLPTPFGAYWLTDATPGDNSSSGDADLCKCANSNNGGAVVSFASRPSPPEDPKKSLAERERQTAKLFAQMDAHCRSDTSRHPGMHKTRTVDYVVLLSGEVTLLLDKGEVDLKPFDVVVQRGTSRAWVNEGKEPALIAAMLIDAKA